MRTRGWLTVWAALCLPLAAASAGEVNFAAKEPVLLTSAGQSADVQMVKILLERNKISSRTSPLAGPDDLQGMKTLAVAVGGSAKGLGAAGIDASKEAARVQKVLDKAKAMGVPVLALMIGGQAKRGELSDPLIAQVTPRAAYLIVVKDGDQDGFISRTAAKANVPIRFVEKLSEVQEPLKTIFGK